MVALKKAGFKKKKVQYLSPLPTDSPGQLDILGHDGNPLGVDGAQVGVFKQSHKVSLTGLLKSSHSRALEAQVGLEVLGNLTHQTLEGELADKQLGRLLVATDFTESHGSGLVTVRLLHSASGGSTLACSLGGQLLPWGLASSRFACSLLGTCHCSR